LNTGDKPIPTLSIVIVNWNAKKQLWDCLNSIEKIERKNFKLEKVIVVDNASVDNSIELIEVDEFNFPLQIIKNSTNKGFGAACNQGATVCHSNYLLFLNPDTRLFENSLWVPVGLMEQKGNEGIGVLGIQLIEESGKIQRSCARFPTLKNFINVILGLSKIAPKFFPGLALLEWDHADSRFVDQIMGAFYLIRSDVFNSLHGFDEDYFIYFEELDLSLRAYKAGFKSYYCVDASAFHKGGGTSEQVKAKRIFYALKSNLTYIAKHFQRHQFWLLFCIILSLGFMSRVTFAIIRLSWSAFVETFKAYKMLYADIPTIFQLLKSIEKKD
jgi:GT2 family glycosyltransferase